MSPSAWRRAHGPDIVAEAIADGRGGWRSRVWLISNPTVMVTTPRNVESASAAQDKADRLARKTFDHRCDGGCGPWTWEALPTT
jgi:hypothetical protein